jgi:hypothetical protein
MKWNELRSSHQVAERKTSSFEKTIRRQWLNTSERSSCWRWQTRIWNLTKKSQIYMQQNLSSRAWKRYSMVRISENLTGINSRINFLTRLRLQSHFLAQRLLKKLITVSGSLKCSMLKDLLKTWKRWNYKVCLIRSHLITPKRWNEADRCQRSRISYLIRSMKTIKTRKVTHVVLRINILKHSLTAQINL